MAVTYIVQQGPSATGPWTAVTGSPFSSANCTISESPGTYYVQITAQDTILGISSTPAAFGPYVVAVNNPNSPVIANANFFDDFTSQNIAWTGWNPSGMATPGNGSIVIGATTYTVTIGGLPQSNTGAGPVTMDSGSGVLGMWNVLGTIWVVNGANSWFSWNGSAFTGRVGSSCFGLD